MVSCLTEASGVENQFLTISGIRDISAAGARFFRNWALVADLAGGFFNPV
jgi:hypothetical protein